MGTETSLTTRQASDGRMSVQDVRQQINDIQHLMKEALQGPTHDNPEGVHYGIVPGTKKPSLLKPGAEKIGMMFRLIPSYQIERLDLDNGHREYIVTCTLSHAPTGQIMGQGVGSCSSMESKYRYRGAGGRACPECGALACKPSKKEFGGGYYCEEKSGGCGKKWKPTTPECKTLDSTPAIKQENPDIADVYNTVSKMAQKRAHVAAILTATAASDIFTQDIEDGGATPQDDGETRPPVQEPRAKAPTATAAPSSAGSAAAPAAASAGAEDATQVAEGTLADVIVQEGTSKKTGKPWKRYGLKVGNDTYGTFDTAVGDAAVALKGCDVKLTWKAEGQYKTAVAIEEVLPY